MGHTKGYGRPRALEEKRGGAGHPAKSGQAAPRSPRSACSVPQAAWSCASAFAADWEGGTVRSKCCALGAAQKRSSSLAHCKSGSRGSSASKPCSRRSLALAATYSGAPMGVPRATNPRVNVITLHPQHCISSVPLGPQNLNSDMACITWHNFKEA